MNGNWGPFKQAPSENIPPRNVETLRFRGNPGWGRLRGGDVLSSLGNGSAGIRSPWDDAVLPGRYLPFGPLPPIRRRPHRGFPPKRGVSTFLEGLVPAVASREGVSPRRRFIVFRVVVAAAETSRRNGTAEGVVDGLGTSLRPSLRGWRFRRTLQEPARQQRRTRDIKDRKDSRDERIPDRMPAFCP